MDPASPSQIIGRWADDEHALFMECLRDFGRDWKRFPTRIPGRTVVQIRTHAQKFFQKLEKQESVSPFLRQFLDAHRMMSSSRMWLEGAGSPGRDYIRSGHGHFKIPMSSHRQQAVSHWPSSHQDDYAHRRTRGVREKPRGHRHHRHPRDDREQGRMGPGAKQGMKRSPSVDLQCEDTYLGYDEEDDDLTASVSPTDPSGAMPDSGYGWDDVFALEEGMAVMPSPASRDCHLQGARVSQLAAELLASSPPPRVLPLPTYSPVATTANLKRHGEAPKTPPTSNKRRGVEPVTPSTLLPSLATLHFTRPAAVPKDECLVLHLGRRVASPVTPREPPAAPSLLAHLPSPPLISLTHSESFGYGAEEGSTLDMYAPFGSEYEDPNILSMLFG